MAFWLVDRFLPGLLSSLIMAGVMWASHRKTRRHIDSVTKAQNEHIDRLTADQTAALSARKMPTRLPKRFLEDYRGPKPEPPREP